MNLVPRMLRRGSFFKKFKNSERGNVLILVGLSMPMLVGLAGLGTDTIQWSLMKQQLQRSADSAALNGAFAKAQSENATTNANLDLVKTLDGFTGVGISVQNAPTSGPFAGNTRAVRVALTYSKALPFSSLFLTTPPTITVDATAAVLNNGDYCVISLEKTNQTGITFSGNSTAELGCGVASNSTGSAAITASGSSSVRATPITAVGIVPSSSNYQTGTSLVSYSIPQRDPFGLLPDPTDSIPNPCSGGKLTVNSNESKTINPGCFTEITAHGNLTMNPGIYYINGGNFTTSARSKVVAIGVTVILTGPGGNIGQVNLNGDANIEMSAPTSGLYQGVIFFKDDDSPASSNDVFNGGVSGYLLGAIYMPSQKVTLNGNASFKTDCLKIVARQIEMSGNSKITNNCPFDPTKDSFTGTQVRLVG